MNIVQVKILRDHFTARHFTFKCQIGGILHRKRVAFRWQVSSPTVTNKATKIYLCLLMHAGNDPWYRMQNSTIDHVLVAKPLFLF